MRYHSKKPQVYGLPRHGKSYTCSHPVYTKGTLYFHDGIGLVIIQQRYDPSTRHTWWDEIDSWLVEDIFTHPEFGRVFSKYARPKQGDIFPTLTVRQLMWALRMKPLPKQPWETVFDRKPI